MQSTYPKALQFVLNAEGLYSDNPDDPGGATMRGITQKEYDAWQDAHGMARGAVKDISMPAVEAIYDLNYWHVISGDSLPYPVDFMAFDTAVNLGNVWAARLLWRSVPAEQQDTVTDALVSLVGQAPAHIAERYMQERTQYYQAIAQEHPALQKFLKGWFNRIAALEKATA